MQQIDLEYVCGPDAPAMNAPSFVNPTAPSVTSTTKPETTITIPLDENMAAGAGIGGTIGVVFGLIGTSLMVMVNSHIVEIVSGFVSSPLMFALSGAGVGAILGGIVGVILYYLSMLANRAAEKQYQQYLAAQEISLGEDEQDAQRQQQWSSEHGHFHLI